MNVNVKLKNNAEIKSLLEFYVANGVDCALDETPHDRFAEMENARKKHQKALLTRHGNTPALEKNASSPAPSLTTGSMGSSAGAAISPSTTQAVPDGVALENARETAAGAGSLEALRTSLLNFDGCNLKRTAKNLVFGDGNPAARLMFVGEAPGRDEDIQGIPFIGRSGELLNKMIAAIGLQREQDVYIANVVPWRPPGNRTPTPQETELCRPFIEQQIALVNPDILVMLGGAAAKQLLNTNDGILKLRGKFRPYHLPDREIEAMATLHPAYLLRQPAQKRLAWQDLIKIRQRLSDKAHTSSASC